MNSKQLSQPIEAFSSVDPKIRGVFPLYFKKIETIKNSQA